MSEGSSGPLAALVAYYRRLEAVGSQTLPAFGFSREKIHFQIVLAANGSLAAFDDIRELNERDKAVPRLLLVPDGGGRSGVGMRPFFCWDNTGYALGRDNKGSPGRAKKMFAAFRNMHLGMRDRVGRDDGYRALCRFLESWKPANAEALPNWAEAVGRNVVFKLRGRSGFVHQSQAVKLAWLQEVANSAGADSTRGVSLLSGEDEDLARLHPLISGVAGTNTTGAAIVSFNLDAFESYGRTQSYNAPVGLRDTFRYVTALNHLLADQSRRVRIGDATLVLWSGRAEATDAEEIFAALFGEAPSGDSSPESGITVDRLRAFLIAARQGHLGDYLKDPGAPFYILGLSPNASRIGVRFWLAGTVAQLAEQLARHASDLEMSGVPSGMPPLVIRSLLDETVPPKKGWPDRDRISPNLAGELSRAVLLGLPYPQSLLPAVVRRIRAEGFVTRDRTANNYRADWTEAGHRRAAILKAYLSRNQKWEVPVALNKDHPDEAYHLGRLFAALEKTQEDGSGRDLNSTIKDRYFGSASASPASVFPLLLRLHQHHINKMENMGLRVNREKLVGEICSRISRFPAHLALERQGLFYIAYYHQRQDFFTKRADSEKGMTDA